MIYNYYSNRTCTDGIHVDSGELRPIQGGQRPMNLRRVAASESMTDTTDEETVVFVAADGTETEAAVRDGETILEAARRVDVDLRWSCTVGECTSCTGRVLDGCVEWLTEPKAVGATERQADFVSLCLTRPATDCRIEVGDQVLTTAFPAVWRAIDPSGEQ